MKKNKINKQSCINTDSSEQFISDNIDMEINAGSTIEESASDSVCAMSIGSVIHQSQCFSDDVESETENENVSSTLESILYKIPFVPDPLIGSPKEVREELDAMVIRIQEIDDKNSEESNMIYNKIHLYMHGYLINVALKQFPYIKGLQTSDIYQEALIALRFKAIPGFKMNKDMSFLNFAKMCIRRYLITILNTSKNRKKDQSMNTAVSIDSSISDDDNSTISSTLQDQAVLFSKVSERKEAFDYTKERLMRDLSDFEKDVLSEYLTNSSYRDIAKTIFEKNGRLNVTEKDLKEGTKAVDNALLRIRKKAIELKELSVDNEDLPMFL